MRIATGNPQKTQRKALKERQKNREDYYYDKNPSAAAAVKQMTTSKGYDSDPLTLRGGKQAPPNMPRPKFGSR